MNLLGIEAMYFSLFGKKLGIAGSSILASKLSTSFGVFSSVHRSTKLKSYPNDIHGCIGFWDQGYKKLKN